MLIYIFFLMKRLFILSIGICLSYLTGALSGFGLEQAIAQSNRFASYTENGNATSSANKLNIDNINTHPVGRKSPNELGIHDMGGNVWEWCNDWFDLYSSNEQTNPKGPSSGAYRVLRGGCWCLFEHVTRVSYRFRSNPDTRDYMTGFRLACNPN